MGYQENGSKKKNARKIKYSGDILEGAAMKIYFLSHHITLNTLWIYLPYAELERYQLFPCPRDRKKTFKKGLNEFSNQLANSSK